MSRRGREGEEGEGGGRGRGRGRGRGGGEEEEGAAGRGRCDKWPRKDATNDAESEPIVVVIAVE